MDTVKSSESQLEANPSSSAKNTSTESSNSSDGSSKHSKRENKEETDDGHMSDHLTPLPPPPRKKSYSRLVVLPPDNNYVKSSQIKFPSGNDPVPEQRTHTRQNTFGDDPLLDQPSTRLKASKDNATTVDEEVEGSTT